uniref:Odorant receptor n=1 Tax=Heliconius melpomene rosina TaxID=171916 RepID=A0A1S5XXL9_HELME|nr:olfactory receptor 22 [Heliconius melpomene rosina]
MALFDNLRKKILGSDFDYDGFVGDLYEFHPQLKILLVTNGIFFNNRDSYWRFLWPVISVLLSIITCAFELMFIHHGVDIEDYSFATECFCYFLIIFTIPIVYTSVMLNRNNIIQILDTMNRDFLFICNLGSKYRKTFLQGQMLIKKLCVCWLIFCVSIVLMYIFSTTAILLYQSLFATQHENMVRPLIFPFWLPADDPYRTPNYEIFFFLQCVEGLIVPQTFSVYIYVLFHILLHHYYLMSMMTFDIEVLFHGLDESVVSLSYTDSRLMEVKVILRNRMRRVVKWHSLVLGSVDAVSSVYGPPLVYQVTITSLVTCLVAYQVADSLDHGKLHVIFTMLFIATCVQLWIPCYLGTLIRNKAFAVGEAMWNSGWHTTPLGRLLRSDIIIFIKRCQKPVSIKFTGLPNLELETFSSVGVSSCT